MLRDFSLTVAPGETVALVGTSGSGKSTVGAAAPPLLRRAHGRSRSTTSTCATSPRFAAPQIGVVFEDSFLFSDTIRNNIGFGRPDASATTSRPRRAPPRRTSSSRAPRRVRHGRRRAGPHALRRPAPAHRARPRAAQRPADPAARRRDLVGRRAGRRGDPRDAAADRGTHDDPHRAPALDPLARGPHRRRGPGRGGRRGLARRAVGALPRSTATCSPVRATTPRARSRRRSTPTTRTADGVTPAAWRGLHAEMRERGDRRAHAHREPRAAVRVAGGRRWRRRMGGGGGMGRRARADARAAREGRRARARDGRPDVDVGARASRRPFGSADFLRPFRGWPLDRASSSSRSTGSHARRPWLIRYGINEGVAGRHGRRCWAATACSSSSRSRTGG